MEEFDDKNNNACHIGLWIPIEVFANDNLTGNEKFLFHIIQMLDNDKGCFASNGYLAFVLKVTSTTISTSISNLIKEQYVTSTIVRGSQRILKIHHDYKKIYRGHLNYFKESHKNFLIHKNREEESFSKEKDTASSLRSDVLDPEQLDQMQGIHTRTLEQPKRSRSANIPEGKKDGLIAIIDMWNLLELRQHKPGSKLYDKTLKQLLAFTSGNLNGSLPKEYIALKGKKFKRSEFNKSFAQFKLAASDSQYAPANKEWLRKHSLSEFLFNPRTGESLFLKYLESETQILAMKRIKDTDPELTEMILNEYYAHQPNLKRENANRVVFMDAANKLQTFFEQNKSRMTSYLTPPKEKLAKWLVKLVFDSANGQVVPPHWLKSKYLFNEKLPLFLIAQNVLKEEKIQPERVVYKPADPRFHQPKADRYEE